MKYLTSSTEEVLQEILTAIEDMKDEIRCFCPKCGQMVLMYWTDIHCPFDCGDECEGFMGYRCPNCIYEWTNGYEPLYSEDEDLVKYNKMRFSV